MEERFWSKVEKTETCWNWKGTFTTHGSPIFNERRTKRYMMRSPRHIILTLLNLKNKYGKYANYAVECGNNTCVNLEHFCPIGRKKLTAIQRDEIRLKWNKHLEVLQYHLSMDRLAKQYGISRQRVEQIVNGKE